MYLILALVCYFVPMVISLVYFIFCFISDYKYQRHSTTVMEVLFAVVLCITPLINLKALEVVFEEFNNYLKRK